MGRSSQLLPALPPDYYAPRFDVLIKGERLALETVSDVLDLSVTLDEKNPAGFSMTLNDWDDERLRFKYSDTTLFDPGRDIVIKIGYADRLETVVVGQITSLSPRFPESGAPTLTVGGQDRFRRLANRKPLPGEPKRFHNKADWQIAQVVAQRNQLRAIVTESGPTHELVVQKNQDDAAFLIERARRIDFEVYVGLDPASNEPALYFTKRKDGRDGTPIRVYHLTWGENLIEYSSSLSTAQQVTSVTVRGWNPKTKKAIVAKADVHDLPGNADGTANGPAMAASDAQDLIVNDVVLSAEEAKRRAVARLMELANSFTQGSGRAIGLPTLRPGDNVQLEGLPKRFVGRYHVTKVDHALGGGGFTTRFDVERATAHAAQKSGATRGPAS